MKELLKKSYEFANLLVNSSVSLLSVLFFSTFKKSFKPLGSNTKDNILVFGNGPSLQAVLDENLQKIKKSDVLVANFFATSKWFGQLKPKFYIFIEPDLYKLKSSAELRVRFKNYDDLVAALNKVDWNMLFYYPSYYKKPYFFNDINNTHIKFVPINIVQVKGFVWLENFIFNHSLGMPKAQNILIAAIFTAIRLGYKKIQVLGADFSWINQIGINEKNEMFLNETHFYDSGKTVIVGKPMSLASHLKADSEALFSLIRLRYYAEYLGVNIFNCTKGSLLDVFDRKDLEL